MYLFTSRFLLRDFVEADRCAFLAYQTDSRYRRLYDIPDGQEHRAHELFDLFLAWQVEQPRRNHQVGIFDRRTHRLCGCGGLRMSETEPTSAVFGIELTPDDWGRYRLTVEAATALINYGIDTLDVERIIGTTASGNTRVEKLARWFGARIVDSRPGPDWMSARAWREVDWAIDKATWISSVHQQRRSVR